MNELSFKFRGKSSKDFGIYVKEDDRVLKPELSRREIIIPGKDGSYDFGDNTYRNRLIRLELGLLGDYTPAELRQKIRDVSFWLDGKGKLVFDDEPDLYYEAKVCEVVPFQLYGSNSFRDGSFNSGVSSVVFDCYPFAFKPLRSIKLKKGINIINYGGTARGPCRIKIKNTGNQTISLIKITHHKYKK